MKIEVNLKKKYTFLVIGVILILAGIVYVIAAVPNPGHSTGEIEPGLFNAGNWRFDGKLGINKAAAQAWDLDVAGDTVFRGKVRGEKEVRGESLCIGNDCISSWSSSGDNPTCNKLASVSNGGKLAVNVPGDCKGEVCNLMVIKLANPPPKMAFVRYIQEIPPTGNPPFVSTGYWYAEGEQVTTNSGFNGAGSDAIVNFGNGAGLWDDKGGGEMVENQWTLDAFNSPEGIWLYLCQD
jgi:hypothetical protein